MAAYMDLLIDVAALCSGMSRMLPNLTQIEILCPLAVVPPNVHPFCGRFWVELHHAAEWLLSPLFVDTRVSSVLAALVSTASPENIDRA